MGVRFVRAHGHLDESGGRRCFHWPQGSDHASGASQQECASKARETLGIARSIGSGGVTSTEQYDIRIKVHCGNFR